MAAVIDVVVVVLDLLERTAINHRPTAFQAGPLALLEGDIGAVLEVVPLVLILVLVVSLVEAFLILPAHLGHAMHHYDPNDGGRVRRYCDRFIEGTRERIVGRAVDALLPGGTSG